MARPCLRQAQPNNLYMTRSPEDLTSVLLEQDKQ